jgi:uncharacterized protein (TIGR00106 family)
VTICYPESGVADISFLRQARGLIAREKVEVDMLAELSVVPMDKGPEGLSRYVAEAIKIIEDSGLEYELHAMGTLIEGPSDKVFDVIRKCHDHMVAQSDRVVTSVKIDDKKGRQNTLRAKVASVEDKLRKG